MVTIRRAADRDIAAIVAVVNTAFQVERDFRAGERTSALEITRLMQNSVFFVAEREARIVGAVLVRVKADTGYFGMLAVDPVEQRSGIGRLLREAAENYCREQGCTVMTLSTGSPRQDLLSYYARFGYRITGVEPAPADPHFAKPIDIVKMAKPL